ncbi:response regulator [Psychrobacillus glaciei]|uniref:Response regulator n=1 Tax=Psychrobacillus glaciei TaxID=2283160 RepID=A0A5J6SK39_9BACI|nr:response regulator [Psychrobacillus glaciei]QFF98042.1 response regulator [Psychrobacillus glaciei]
MLKAIMVDDEILAIELLEAMLKEIGGIKIIGKFSNPLEGLESLEALQPDILFLDIEMKEMNGIKLAEKIESLDFQADIVFVTAYDEYALEAFNVQAVDYILKPIEKSRLEKTVRRIGQRRKQPNLPPNKSPLLHASFLGGFRVDHQQEAIKWRTKKVKEFCAYLIHQDKPVHREKIMEELWPDRTIDKASAMLHTSVYHLRKELKNHGFHDSIKYVDERYSLSIAFNSDVQNLQKVLNQTHVKPEDVKQLIDLYKNHYLAEEYYDWALEEREQLQKRVEQFLEKFIAFNQMDEKTDSVLKEAIDKLIEMDPWEERYTTHLVQYYIQQGNPRTAMQVYHNYKAILWNQLGVKPQKKLEDLMKSI